MSDQPEPVEPAPAEEPPEEPTGHPEGGTSATEEDVDSQP
jgi:hypothetical protein